MSALYDTAVAAFDEEGWRHSTPTPHTNTLGTSIRLGDRLIGGSLTVHGTTVRFCAFGASSGIDRFGAFAELFGIVNPALPTGSFELDPTLGPVCRTGVDLAGALDEDGAPRDERTVRDLVLGIAVAATGVFEGFVNVLEQVAAGADPAAVLRAHGWNPDALATVGSAPTGEAS